MARFGLLGAACVLSSAALVGVGAPVSAQENGRACSTAEDHHGIYFFRDYQYYKPMMANIRSPRAYVRHYAVEDPVPFTNRAPDGTDHSVFGFFDFGYGESFPLMGWNLDTQEPENCLEANGLALFIQGSAHSLIDMDTESHDVLNTDFRIGGGLVARFAKHLSARLQYFHESTHVGDEYVLGAVDDDDFLRYNVSYEAWEAYLAADHYDAENDLDGGLSVRPVYARAYGGARLLTSGLRGTFDRTFEAYDLGTGTFVPDPLRVGRDTEFQLGGELFWDCFRLPEDEPGGNAFWRITHFQYLFAAGDLYVRDRYDHVAPERVPSLHLMVGAAYGPYFRGERSVQWAIHRYDGVNPHGQFRSTELDYWAISFALKF